MRECVKHPDLSCRYQNRVLIIYTLCTVSFYPPPPPQSWSLYSFITTNSPSKQFISLHIEIPYLHDDSPQRQKCNVLYVCHLHNGFVDENACWASITTSQTWNNKKHVKHQEISKWNRNQKTKFIGWYFSFPLHQLTVNRTHDDPCSASLGLRSHKEWLETLEALQQTPK